MAPDDGGGMANFGFVVGEHAIPVKDTGGTGAVRTAPHDQ